MNNSWIFENEEINSPEQIPHGAIGFVYKITTLADGMIYIGKKSLYSTRKRKFGKKEAAAVTDKRKKKHEHVTKLMPKWEAYTGSCEPLNKEIANGALYRKEILCFCFKKQEMSYYELKFQMIEGVIEPGSTSYNGNILGKFYPKLFSNGHEGEV